MNNLTNPYAWLYIVLVFIQHFTKSWVFTHCFKCKVKNFIIYLSYAISGCVIVIPYTLFCCNPAFQPIIIIATAIILGFIFSENSHPKHTIISFWLINILVEAITELFLSLPFTYLGLLSSQDPVNEFTFIRFLGSFVFTILFIPANYFHYILWNRFINKVNIKIRKTHILFIVFPIAQIIAFFLIILRYTAIELESINDLSLTIIAFILFGFSDIVILYYVADVEAKCRLELCLQELEYAYKQESAYYRELENKNYEITKIRHDIKNHIITLKNLREIGNEDEVTVLLNELESNMNNATLKKYCHIPVVNAIISEKENFCKEKDINIYINISIDNIGKISTVHISSIFSNLIDNAINSILKNNNTERYIKLNAIQQGEYIIVSCSNLVSEIKNRILNPEESKGYGLKILKDISQKYDGAFKAEIKNGMCVAEIMVRIASMV